MKIFFFPLALLAALAPLRADESATTTLKFSHPDKPEAVHIHLAHGSIKVLTTESNEAVTITSTAQPDNRESPRADGLRVIGSSARYSAAENDNVVNINYGAGSGGRAHAEANFTITIPSHASLQISDEGHAEMSVDGVLGDLEVLNMNGEVKLTNLGGGAVVETMNGQIHASFRSITVGKALSFSSMNGQVEVHLPADSKANVRFRTQNGTILTDFPEDVLKTTSEPSLSDEAIRDREAAHQAAQAAKVALQEAREKSRNSASNLPPGTPPPIPAIPHSPVIPAIVGGKVVSGTLNGGGVDLQISTMNGDIVVRNNAKNP